MPLKNLDKAPFPWFGGKRHAAPAVWAALGDVPHYVEPFAGSLAVLLCRPHQANRPYHSETVNDADAMLVNAWRAIQADPDGVADAGSWPVSEVDMMARELALLQWRGTEQAERLRADPRLYDVEMAGWWLWGVSATIGVFASGDGPWSVDGGGKVAQQGRSGVKRARPHLSSNGQGINRPQAREPGVGPDLRDWDPDTPESAYHPHTMPEIRRWMRYLSARLRHVRILHGDWARCCTSGAAKTLPVREGAGPAGIFLDPPYGAESDRDMNVYAVDCGDIAGRVRDWCLEHGPDPDYRIVLAGYEVEHAELADAGWTEIEWFRAGFLRGGMGNTKRDGTHQQDRERLWLSPHCITETDRQVDLFGCAR